MKPTISSFTQIMPLPFQAWAVIKKDEDLEEKYWPVMFAGLNRFGSIDLLICDEQGTFYAPNSSREFVRFEFEKG